MKTKEQKWETLETEEGERQVSAYAKVVLPMIIIIMYMMRYDSQLFPDERI
jgi:hypothetical protein